MPPPRLLDQRFEQRALLVELRKILRVPLHAERERQPLVLDRLHDAVAVARRDADPVAEPVDALTVQRVDAAGVLADHAGQRRSRLRDHALAREDRADLRVFNIQPRERLM